MFVSRPIVEAPKHPKANLPAHLKPLRWYISNTVSAFVLIISLTSLGLLGYLYYFSLSQPYFGASIGFDGKVWSVREILWAGQAQEAGLRRGTVVISVNDQPPAEVAKGDRLVRSRSINKITYLDEVGNIKSLSIAGARPSLRTQVEATTYFLVGLSFFVMGMLSLLSKARNRAMLALFGCGTTTAFAVVSVLASGRGIAGALELHTVALTLAPWSALLFLLQFPRPKSWMKGSTVFIALLAIPALLVGLYLSLGRGESGISELFRSLNLLNLALVLLACTVAMIHSYATASTELARRQIKMVLLSVVAAISIFVGLNVLPEVILSYPLVPLPLGILGTIAIPSSIAYAVLRHKLFDVDFFISRAVAYGLVYLMITLAYFGTMMLVINGPAFSETGRLTLVVVFSALVLPLFGPLKGFIQSAVDRRLYRDAYDYRSAVKSLGATLERVQDTATLAHFLANSLTSIVGLEGCCFLLRDSKGRMKVISGAGTLNSREARGHIEATIRQARESDFFPDPAPSDCPAAFLIPLGEVAEPLGVLALAPKASRAEFTAKDLDFFAMVQDQATLCLRNLLLLAEASKHRVQLEEASERLRDYSSSLEQAQAELQNAYLGMATSLVMALESRDTYTRGHSERVAQLARQTGFRLGLSRDDLKALELAGKLHDVGKVGIPDGILRKASSLEPHERSEVQLHPLRSVEILMPLGFLKEALPIIESHHEYYDGSGHPHGLRGEEIPLGGRILAVCDAYDAMTSARPYRSPFSHDEALRRLKEGAGTQWDPAVVEGFVETVSSEHYRISGGPVEEPEF